MDRQRQSQAAPGGWIGSGWTVALRDGKIIGGHIPTAELLNTYYTSDLCGLEKIRTMRTICYNLSLGVRSLLRLLVWMRLGVTLCNGPRSRLVHWWVPAMVLNVWSKFYFFSRGLSYSVKVVKYRHRSLSSLASETI
jgi:hypothetical protein